MDLKVDQLRELLAKRGLSTAGTKSTLVKRLEAAIQEDLEKSAAGTGGDSSNKRKRPRDSDLKDADSDGQRKFKTIDELSSNFARRPSSEGFLLPELKKQLLQSLSVDANDHPSDNDQVPGL